MMVVATGIIFLETSNASNNIGARSHIFELRVLENKLKAVTCHAVLDGRFVPHLGHSRNCGERLLSCEAAIRG